MNGETSEPSGDAPKPQWRPLTSLQRRVAGVLIEKAKTTPDGYPMSVNAITTGCNQKSNRDPVMSVDPDDVEQTLDELRNMGAVAEIHGGGRVPKYRHYMYEWLGVDKHEIAVMAELLLRGEQTVGELRGRASRMESIAGLNELKPILQSLIDKKLVVSLTPEGRGQVVSHTLYTDREMEAVRRVTERQAAEAPSRPPRQPAASSTGEVAALREELTELRSEVNDLKDEVEQLRSLMQG